MITTLFPSLLSVPSCIFMSSPSFNAPWSAEHDVDSSTSTFTSVVTQISSGRFRSIVLPRSFIVCCSLPVCETFPGPPPFHQVWPVLTSWAPETELVLSHVLPSRVPSCTLLGRGRWELRFAICSNVVHRKERSWNSLAINGQQSGMFATRRAVDASRIYH